ncbi:MAG TPA: YetF domain-containing protein [Chitinophaga sp.]|uniref:DUF421 domain-containing protein n=1 Tax=Chitinophaga sp. TaxID=1869181 RepID=UPI002F944F06
MEAKDIHFSDWQRILIGEVPPGYFIELLIRAIVVYLILMVSMRTMGKRMSSQLSRNELAALVSLAAAVGIPMMAPDRGVLPALVIAFVLITVERMIAKRGFSDQKFESFVQGDLSTLVNDGIIDMKALAKVKLSHERVLAQLRSMGILQLGTVKRFYMESSGNFTLVRSPQPRPGLSVLPPWDDPMRNCFHEHPDEKICMQCGFPKKQTHDPDKGCPNCGAEKWVTAVEEVSNDKNRS